MQKLIWNLNKIRKTNFKLKNKKKFLYQHQGLILFTTVYLITFLLMLPLQSMAFEDDFTYIQTTEHLAKTGELKMQEFVGVSLIFQTVWGALFAKIFGFSIGILHLSNIVLMYFGLCAFYSILKILGLKEFRAALFTIFLFSFPWILQFTYSYMTDTFYMSLLLISIFFYIKAFQTNLKIYYLLGSFIAGLSFIQRQNGLIIPLAIIISFIFQFIATKKILWKEFILALLPFCIFVIGYSIWINLTGPTIAQIKLVHEPIQKDFLPKLFPHNLKRSISLTEQYYITVLIKRALAYFDNAIVFLLPIFLIYKFQFSKLFNLIKTNLLLIFFTALVITIAYFIDYVTGRAYTKYPPGLILRYEYIFTSDWNTWWPRLVWISRIIWVVILAITIKNIFQTLFIPKTKYVFKLFNKIALIYSVLLITFFIFYLRINFPSVLNIKRIASIINSWSFSTNFLSNLENLFASKQIIIALQSSWFFLVIIFSIFFMITFIIITQKLKKLNHISLSLLFLGSILLLSFYSLCFFTRIFYEEYLIQFIPIVILWFAYLFRKIPISLFQAIIVVCFVLLFSLSGTRLRYQIEGISWQLGIKLVEQGIHPDYIHINWPWKPYWYYDRVFPKILAEYTNKNKYDMPSEKWSGWTRGYPLGTHYEFVPVPINTQPTDNLPQSKPFWLFFREGQLKLITKTYIEK